MSTQTATQSLQIATPGPAMTCSTWPDVFEQNEQRREQSERPSSRSTSANCVRRTCRDGMGQSLRLGCIALRPRGTSPTGRPAHFCKVADAAPLAAVPLPPTGSTEQNYREPRTGAARSLSPPPAAGCRIGRLEIESRGCERRPVRTTTYPLVSVKARGEYDATSTAVWRPCG